MFSCPCLNVRIQRVSSLLSADDNADSGKSFAERLAQAAAEHQFDKSPAQATLNEIFSRYFGRSNSYFLLKTSLFFADKVGRSSIESDLSADYLSIKHRQLVGKLTGPNVALYKCVNCNCFTHCVLASAHFKSLRQHLVEQEPAPSASQQGVQLDYLNENTNMSGSIESLSQHLITATHAHLSSQSSWQTMSSDTGFADSNSNSNSTADSASILQRVLIVSNQMIFNQDELNALMSSADYSNVFEMVLAAGSSLDQSRIAENHALNLTFSLAGLSAGESVESYAERLYKQKNSNEDAFKPIFVNLVKAYVNTGALAQSAHVTDAVEAASQLEAMAQSEKKLKKKQRKASFREDLAAADVFEFEEIDDNDLYQKQNSSFSKYDDGYGDDNSDDNDSLSKKSLDEKFSSPSGLTSILKKRNSNVGKLGNSPVLLAGDATTTTTSPPTSANRITIAKQNSTERKSRTSVHAKYSFSLPRDIPIMGHRMTMPIPQGDSDDENEPVAGAGGRMLLRKAPLLPGEKENETGHEDLSFMINDSVNMNDSDDDDDDDDELFSSDKYDGEELKDMGQAISNLASSIVQKDGRELFGGVPSRRIPINSISKSCLD